MPNRDHDIGLLLSRLHCVERRQRLTVLALSVVGSLAAVFLLAAARGPAPRPRTLVPGCVVVEPGNSGDDTAAIQNAIDSLGPEGGAVLFAAGTYRHTGLRGRANLHLRGVGTASAVIDYTPSSGDGITLPSDPDYFALSDLTLTSSGQSTGWAVRASAGAQRSLQFSRINVGGFENGIYIANALNCTVDGCRIGHRVPPGGIGVQFGDGKTTGGNGVTIQDCYFNSLKKGVVTYAQAMLVLRPIFELCEAGLETHGTTVAVHPWVSNTNRHDVRILPNTVGGLSGTGALLLGYGSGGWRIDYGTATERRRTIVIPERFDVSPGDDPADPHGVQFGKVVIDHDGMVHAKGVQELP
ncbi:MAG: right-handed parallel beta-helix repeat-containing protein [Pirellulales bacterium]|nr:right-handed parallel beta-helix repeat-containing protein [Pirellulales bacterium]